MLVRMTNHLPAFQVKPVVTIIVTRELSADLSHATLSSTGPLANDQFPPYQTTNTLNGDANRISDSTTA